MRQTQAERRYQIKLHEAGIYRPRACRMRAEWRPMLNAVCKRHGIKFEEAMTYSRAPRLVACRQEMWWVLNVGFEISLAEIGARLGGFDHTSVMHGVAIWQARIDADRMAA